MGLLCILQIRPMLSLLGAFDVPGGKFKWSLTGGFFEASLILSGKRSWVAIGVAPIRDVISDPMLHVDAFIGILGTGAVTRSQVRNI